MSDRVEKAVNYHKNFYSCSAAVGCAFADAVGIPEQDVRKAVAPFAGGRMGKCGAVLAAEYILTQKYGEDAAKARIEEFEKKFTEMNKSLMCKELKGALTGTVLRSCRGCVNDAAELLDGIIDGEDERNG